MYKQYSMLIEQGQTPYAAVAPTDYSEEDLFSDFLGFWQQIYGKSDQDIRNICVSFVRWQGDQVGIAASLYVYDNVYGGWMSPTWKRGWTSFEPRLIPLPQLNFSSAWSPIYNQCSINHSARCMPSEISTLLALEKTDPQDYTAWLTLLPEWKRFSDQNVALGTWIH
jgi:hypothetical protein